VFVVNLARGTGGTAPAIHVSDDEGHPQIAVGSSPRRGDGDERLRDREETKRLLYVAVTRARDALYFSSVLDGGRLRPGPGSLAEVLPDCFRHVFEEAGGSPPGVDLLEWVGPRGGRHRVRTCRPRRSVPRPAGS
jgi:hypothetical protein